MPRRPNQDTATDSECLLPALEVHIHVLQRDVPVQRGVAAVVEVEREIVAEELRIAIHALGRLLGRVDVEEILDSIFREFCIGK